MSGSRPIYYWDTCLFLAWIKNEVTRKPGEMEGLADVLKRFERREVSIITSVISVVEMSVAKLPAGGGRIVDQLMQKPGFTRVAVDIRVADLARDLRDHYLSRHDEFSGRTLSVPDSIHVATAIRYRATEMHTFDGRNNNRQNTLGLLPLTGDLGGHALKICMPPVPIQQSLLGLDDNR